MKQTSEFCFAVHRKDIHRLWGAGSAHSAGTLTCFQQLNTIKMWRCFSNVTHSWRGQTLRNSYNCQKEDGNVGGELATFLHEDAILQFMLKMKTLHLLLGVNLLVTSGLPLILDWTSVIQLRNL